MLITARHKSPGRQRPRWQPRHFVPPNRRGTRFQHHVTEDGDVLDPIESPSVRRDLFNILF